MKIIGLGDSLMQFNRADTYPQTGWIQVLDRYLSDPMQVRIYDFALNGRSTKSFIDEGRYQQALEATEKGDLVLISFGHNDEKKEDPTRYCPPFTTYQENLGRFYDEMSKKGARVIFLTSIERVKFREGVLENSHGDYPLAMKQLAAAKKAELIDLNYLTHQAYIEMGQEAALKNVMCLKPGEYVNYPEGKEDTTHLKMNGAMWICSLVVKELKKLPKLSEMFI